MLLLLWLPFFPQIKSRQFQFLLFFLNFFFFKKKDFVSSPGYGQQIRIYIYIYNPSVFDTKNPIHCLKYLKKKKKKGSKSNRPLWIVRK